jgi:hypothetical protein
MTILINDLARHSAGVGGEIRRAIENVVASGWYVLGKQLSVFEEVFAEYCGVGHCVGVANGTDALELSFRGLGIGPGTRVATVANAGFYTTTALNAVGAAAVFVDVDSVNHLMNLELLGALASDHRIDYVPYVGGLLGITLAIVVSVITYPSLAAAALPPIAYLTLQLVEGNFVTPMILGHRLDLNTVAILILLSLTTWMWGIVGTIIGVPLLVVIKVFSDNFPALSLLPNSCRPRLIRPTTATRNRRPSGQPLPRRIKAAETTTPPLCRRLPSRGR